MAEYIDREAVIEKFRRMLRVKHGMNERFFADSVFAVIENFPAADVAPVVRCKDCKHWHKDTMFCDYMPYGEASERVNWYADDFCSYGERKDGDDE